MVFTSIIRSSWKLLEYSSDWLSDSTCRGTSMSNWKHLLTKQNGMLWHHEGCYHLHRLSRKLRLRSTTQLCQVSKLSTIIMLLIYAPATQTKPLWSRGMKCFLLHCACYPAINPLILISTCPALRVTGSCSLSQLSEEEVGVTPWARHRFIFPATVCLKHRLRYTVKSHVWASD